MLARRLISSTILLIVLLFGVTSRAWVRECSLRTLNGRYGFVTQGTLLVTSPQLPFASMGIVTFDGQGKFSGTYSQSAGGSTATGLKFDGTYQVNSDCTVSSTLTGGGNRVGVITGESFLQEIHLIFTDPSSVAYVTYKKIPQRFCSSGTLKGDYGVFGHGETFSSGSPTKLVAQSGAVTFDGAGNFSGTATTNTSGVVATGPVTGTYTVNSDCNASLTWNSGASVLHEALVITGYSDFREIQGLITDQGWVFTNTFKKQ